MKTWRLRVQNMSIIVIRWFWAKFMNNLIVRVVFLSSNIIWKPWQRTIKYCLMTFNSSSWKIARIKKSELNFPKKISKRWLKVCSIRQARSRWWLIWTISLMIWLRCRSLRLHGKKLLRTLSVMFWGNSRISWNLSKLILTHWKIVRISTSHSLCICYSKVRQ